MGKFPLKWKANIVQIYEKGDEQKVSIYYKICFTFTKLWLLI